MSKRIAIYTEIDDIADESTYEDLRVVLSQTLPTVFSNVLDEDKRTEFIGKYKAVPECLAIAGITLPQVPVEVVEV